MAKLTPITPDDAANESWREITKLETTTPALGGTTTFDGSDDPTAGHMNAQGIQISQNLEMLRHRNGADLRNAVLYGATDSSGNAAYLNCTATDSVTVLGASENLIVSFANGYGKIGQVDHIGVIDADVVVDATSILSGANGYYPVFAIYDTSDGTISYAFGVQFGLNSATPWEVSKFEPSLVGANVPDRYWYDPQKGQSWRTEGSPGSVAWVRVCAVWLGWVELDTNLLVISGDLEAGFDGAAAGSHVAAGIVVAHGATSAPAGWLLCNGGAVSRLTYARLFATIGTTFGVGDGSTTFNVPDLRGEFVRGYDASRGVDSGRVFGSAQAEDVGPHTHDIESFGSNGANGGSYSATHSVGGSFITSDSGSGTETRPRNVALAYIIKY